MKTKLLILLAAVAMLFTACKKDEPTIADNTFIYNDVTYHMTNLELYGGIGGELVGESTESGPQGYPAVEFCGHHILQSQLNKTFDLTQYYTTGSSDIEELQLFVCGEVADFSFRIDKEWWDGRIGETFYDHTIFTEGTMTITGDENSDFVYTASGKLINGDSFEFRIVLPEGWYNWQPE